MFGAAPHGQGLYRELGDLKPRRAPTCRPLLVMPDPLDIFVDGHHVRYKAYAPAKGRSARQFKFCIDWDIEQKPEDAWTRFQLK